MAFEALRCAWMAAPPEVHDSAARPPLPLEELIELARCRDLIGQPERGT